MTTSAATTAFNKSGKTELSLPEVVRRRPSSAWKRIKTFKEIKLMPFFHPIDVWMDIPASPMSMGMSDSFRVTDAWSENGKWYHYQGGDKKELNGCYITHWMRIPKGPKK